MTRRTYESYKVHWLPAVADVSAPTAAEITAGTDITPQIPVDGVAFDETQNNASQAMLGDAFVAQLVGTWSSGVTLTFTRDDGTDAAWDLFDYRTNGFLLISPFGDPVAGSDVYVYPAQSHAAALLTPAENEFQKFQVQLAVTETPNKKAVVAA